MNEDGGDWKFQEMNEDGEEEDFAIVASCLLGHGL